MTIKRVRRPAAAASLTLTLHQLAVAQVIAADALPTEFGRIAVRAEVEAEPIRTPMPGAGFTPLLLTLTF
ncbi:hypothetical protein [Ramlibacter sp.]|uniref:hypothetical protein n=1 Tax=Ramlibacter sp. TaxID=1917967 RepID=UPI003D1000DF